MTEKGNADNDIIKSTYQAQEKLSFFGFMLEIPCLLFLAVSACLIKSALVWVSFLDALCYVLQTGLVYVISRKLKRDNRFTYNYGIERLEAMTAFTCDILLCIGAICVVILSIDELIHPSAQSEVILYTTLLEILEVIIDFILLWKQYKIFKKSNNTIAKIEYYSAIKDLALDLVYAILLGTCYLFRNGSIGSYISAVSSLIICAFSAKGRIADLVQRTSDLTDKTLDEEHQLAVIKILNHYNSQYSMLCSVNSHRLDEKIFIDFYLDFTPETTYKEITALENALQKDISEIIENSEVSIVFSNPQS